MSSENTSFAQRSGKKIHFDHKDMDYYLSWILGREIYHGSDREESLSAARRITSADADSWHREWSTLARQVQEQAEHALQNGEHETARKAFLRASTYHRAPLFIMGRKHPDFYRHWQSMQSCFRNGAQLFNPVIEPIEVPFEGQTLPGYFWKVDNYETPRPTLVVVGGVETWAEDCYFMIGPAGAERGYNVITADLAGQGMNPDQGLHFGARMEVTAKALVDYALSRPEVDPSRLALYGFSWGGHIAFKAARFDSRIRAMIANPPMPDVFRSVLAQQKDHNRHDPISRTAFDQIVWRFGLKISFHPRDIAARFGKAWDYLTNGKVDVKQIRCPALLLAGEGEAEVTLKIVRECFKQLPNPQKKMVIFTREQGGEAHCQIDNLALPNQTMFDWMDELWGHPKSNRK
ncbi:MAG TPA: alpha/beta fold hydrolase [Anaerolineales bacterium]|nr:alpha/beta fold hydrolase [Anaerolineales bacterium]